MSSFPEKRIAFTRDQANSLIQRLTVEISAISMYQPLLSVAVLTYNHARFIEQALDSVLMQQVEFSYELVVGDDCSTDGTTEIILGYQRRHPDKIRVLLTEENMGKATGNGRLNLIRTLRACRGSYIAFCEGDDFWTSPQKLERQMQVLMGNTETILVSHRTCYVSENGKPLEGSYWESKPGAYSDLNVLAGTYDHPNSWVFRRVELSEDFVELLLYLPMGDDPLCLHLLQYGEGISLCDRLSAYRQHPGGIWSSLGALRRAAQEHVLLLSQRRFYKEKYERHFCGLIARHRTSLAELLAGETLRFRFGTILSTIRYLSAFRHPRYLLRRDYLPVALFWLQAMLWLPIRRTIKMLVARRKSMRSNLNVHKCTSPDEV